jgi:hypothetical protein
LGAAVSEDGRAAPGQMGGRKPKAIAGTPSFWSGASGTARSPCADWWPNSPRGLKVDYRSVWNFVHAEQLSFKKPSSPANAIGVARRRA